MNPMTSFQPYAPRFGAVLHSDNSIVSQGILNKLSTDDELVEARVRRKKDPQQSGGGDWDTFIVIGESDAGLVRAMAGAINDFERKQERLAAIDTLLKWLAHQTGIPLSREEISSIDVTDKTHREKLLLNLHNIN